MAIIAAGARYDLLKGLQAIVIITSDNGGHPNHLTPHKKHAEKLGHHWIDIEPDVYNSFASHTDLVAHIRKMLP